MQPRRIDGYPAGPVLLVCSALSTVNPVSNGVMHWSVAAPHRSFCTTYLPPPTVLDPNWSQIDFAAGAGAAVVVAAALVVVPPGVIGFVAADPTAFPMSTVPSVTARARHAASR